MKTTSSTNQTSRVKHAGAEVASLPSADTGGDTVPASKPSTSAPTVLGAPCVRYVSQSPSALTRMAAQDWVWIRPDIGAVIKIWSDGTWVWEHLSGAIEKQGHAEGTASEPGNEYSAARDAQRALVDRAKAILGAVTILAPEAVGAVKS